MRAICSGRKWLSRLPNSALALTGFLKTGSKGSAQGNYGLMDLVAGLHWLRENLGAFGGDPERLALLGHGTGAALANFLAVSPMAKGKVFNRFAANGRLRVCQSTVVNTPSVAFAIDVCVYPLHILCRSANYVNIRHDFFFFFFDNVCP